MFRKSKKEKTKDGNIDHIKVALIGCGPGAMSFLHALQKHKADGVLVPEVTCYERGPGPGGLWRDIPVEDKSRVKPENSSLMYDDMWTNTPKELMEYYDYTFDDHFKEATPSFLPRKDILNYIIARNSVDGALDNVKYNHTVEMATYDSDNKKFTVQVTDNAAGTTSDEAFDKCIWAAGLNAIAEKPEEIMELLKDFTGKVMHSIEATEGFGSDVKGKNVLIVGDSCSSEDLALRAVKLGAKHVYICARSGEGSASSTKVWPLDKITVISGPPYKVLKGNTIKCRAVYWSEKRQRYRKDDDELPVKVKDIATVILCTGYDANHYCLDESLQLGDDGQWTISKGWKMINNSLTISVGSPKPCEILNVGSTCYPDVVYLLLILT